MRCVRGWSVSSNMYRFWVEIASQVCVDIETESQPSLPQSAESLGPTCVPQLPLHDSGGEAGSP